GAPTLRRRGVQHPRPTAHDARAIARRAYRARRAHCARGRARGAGVRGRRALQRMVRCQPAFDRRRLGAYRGHSQVSLTTRCPVCATAFRVQRAQLAARGGKVRCGKCGEVFNGIAGLVEEGTEPLILEPSPQLGLFDPSRRPSTPPPKTANDPPPPFMAEDEPVGRGLLWGLLALSAAVALAAQAAYRYR